MHRHVNHKIVQYVLTIVLFFLTHVANAQTAEKNDKCKNLKQVSAAERAVCRENYYNALTVSESYKNGGKGGALIPGYSE